MLHPAAAPRLSGQCSDVPSLGALDVGLLCADSHELSVNSRMAYTGASNINSSFSSIPNTKGLRPTRRWVYVFAISQQGKGTLLFPRLDSGNEGNHLPRAEKDEKPLAPAVPLLRLLDQSSDLEVSEPWGIDTYIVISTKEAIPNPGIFDFDGVQSIRSAQSRGNSGSPLQDLLDACGNSTRGTLVAKAPSEWSIERITFRSARKM